jgi:Putative zinc-finger
MQHLDEGTIHAWLDGALTADESARVERHARECKDCAVLVAEARGLVAGASRILSALDEVPAVGAGGGTLVASRARRRPFWSRPATLAAAAAVVLMAGSAVVLNEVGGPESLGTVAGGRGMAAATSEASADTTAAAGGPSMGIAPSAGMAPSAGSAEGAAGRDGVARQVASVDANAPTAAPRPRERVRAAPANQAPSRAPQARVDIPPQYKRAESQYARDTAQLEAAATTPVTGAVASAMASKEVRETDKAAPVAQRKAMDAAAAPPTAAPAAPAVSEEGRRAAARTMAPERTDTIVVSRVDTVIVEPPDMRAGFGAAGRARTATQTFLTGCYEVVEGRAPRSITLTTKAAWSGTAEQRFVATAPGAIGYWSQPTTGDVHIVIAGTLVTARVDALTGDLRGKAQRGGKSERFVARRGCR